VTEWYALDTNVIFDLLNQQEDVTEHYGDSVDREAKFLLCPVVYFEVMRGFVHRPDPEDERDFAVLAAGWRWEDLQRSDWHLASELWADGQGRGRRPSDADVLIAAFARNRGTMLVTADVKAFDHLAVATENWGAED
jgi:predicted nucleic acid-binding protein